MRILITGSAGFLGSHTVEHFLENTSWEIVGLDSFRHRGDSERVYHLLGDRYKIFNCDLSAPISERLLKKIGDIDVILNLASDSHVDRSIIDPVPFVQNNLNLMLSVLEMSKALNPSMFIHCSTDEVFGPALNKHCHKEDEPFLPSNPYSASKSAQECIAFSYWRTFGLPLVITRCMNLIGERQDKEKFLPLLISKIFRDEQVTIHGSQKVVGSRMYLHCRNLADAWMFLIKKTAPTKYKDSMDTIQVPDRYNIAGLEEIDNLELAQMVANVLNRKLKYTLVDFHHQRAGHDRRYALDSTKITNLGWVAPVSFKESLEKTIRWTINNPEWM